MKYTVLGATGFVGSHVAELARRRGHEVFCPARDERLDGQELGHLIYSIGLTSDFRQRPHDTVTAHVTKLQEVLTRTQFESLVYLSSTRVYARCTAAVVSEDLPIPAVSTDFSDLYNLSKLMGESIALTHGPKIKIARLSNVIGADFQSDNFLISVVRDCVEHGCVKLRTSLASAKDFIAVEDVADVLLRLGVEGTQPIYNVASGRQTTNEQIVSEMVRLTGATISVAEGSPTVSFPQIDVSRLASELGFVARPLETILPKLVNAFRRWPSRDIGKDAA